jgi:hypothetical protein
MPWAWHRVWRRVRVEAPYARYEAIVGALNDAGARDLATHAGSAITLQAEVPVEALAAMSDRIADLSAGRARVEIAPVTEG